RADYDDARGDVPPLVRAAHLQGDAQPPVQLQEVDGLHQHVVELEEGHRLLALEPQPDRVEAQHAVDGEVRAVLAQELNVAVGGQPLVVVEHDRPGRAVAEVEELLEHRADRGDVRLDGFVGQLGPRGVLAGRVADLGGAAAHQYDRLVTRLLQPAQHHDLDQAADVQRRGGGVEADVAGQHARGRRLVQPGRVGDLMDVAARLQGAQELGLEGGVGHGRFDS